jgi:hypothetical protein
METLSQAQSIDGSHNVVLSHSSIGGDVHFGDVQILSDSQFYEPSLGVFAPEVWVDPPRARELVDLLAEHRLLILAGDLDDKTECARQLAYFLTQRLSTQGVDNVRVRERCRGNDPQRIETALQGEPTILLLVEMTPAQIVGYTPGKLRAQLRQSQSYAIITTDCTRTDWTIEGTSLEAQLWCDLSWRTYYGPELLAEFLMRQLARAECPLPEGMPLESAEDLEAMATQLKGPGQIQYFTEWLLTLEGSVSREQVEEQLVQLTGDQHGMVQWYRQFDARDQLFVLGLTLLDGLPDDLLFACLEILVETTWRSSDPGLRQFDHNDLERFSAYFKQVETDDGFVRVQSGSQERRQQILKVVWKFQRRRLLATLPALTRLIRISVTAASPEPPEPPREKNAKKSKEEPRRGEKKPKADDDHELRISRTGTLQLHQALAESLSLIGLLSIDVVKPYYLDLAADPSESVRQLAARALSAWRDTGHEKELFELLQSWWTAALTFEEGDSQLDRLSRADGDPRSAVRSAVAMTVGYAARFDRANRLAPQLFELLVTLVEDKDPRVRRTFVRSTLPHVVAWHFRQLEPVLRTKVLLAEDLLAAVAFGAAEACTMRPEESLAILDGWKSAAKADRRKTSPLLRERLLATVALTYGYIRCEDGRSQLSAEAIGSRLRSMLVEELHPYVRHYAFFAIEVQAVRNFEVVALILQDLLSQITLFDRPAAVEVFVRTYLEQRLRLPGGDRRITVGERSYPVWIDSRRPLTEIEASLYGWIMDNSRPSAQQLAIDIFEALAETALEREEARLQVTRPRPVQMVKPGTPPPARTPPKVHKLPWLGRMAVFLAVPRKPRVRAILSPLLAQVIAMRRRRSSLRTVVSSEEIRPTSNEGSTVRAKALLNRWKSIPNDATNAIARHLKRALALYRWRWGIIGVTLLIITMLSYGSWLGYQLWQLHLALKAVEATPAGVSGLLQATE